MPDLVVVALWPFASGGMLLWGLAALAPLVIHWWSRRRYDEVTWAAMNFLLRALRKNARRWRIEQILLLAVRMLILILLAVALADPVVSRSGTATGAAGAPGDTHHVLVIDASYSMDYRDEERTRFEQARQWAADQVRNSPQGDGFTLVRLATPPHVVIAEPVFDRQDMIQEIFDLRRSDGGADLPATLAEIDRLVDLARERAPRLHACRIAVFTDLQRNTWEGVTRDTTRAVLNRLGEKADLEWFDVGRQGGGNLAVTRLAASEAVATVGHPVRLDVEVQSFGDQAWTRHGVEVLVDGQPIAAEKLDVPAGQRVNLSVVHRFTSPGDAVVEARLADDPIGVDNTRWLSLAVRPALEVLCVEGQAGAAKHVLLALEPDLAQLPRVRAVAQSEIALLEEDLRRYDGLFLCNVGRFGRDEARLLRAYLQQGGGMVVLLGDQVQAANYNRVVGVDADRLRMLPARLHDPVPLGDYFFDPLDYAHPIVQPFQGHQRSGLLTTPVWKYIPLTPLDSRRVRVALAFNTGDPAIVEERIGRGRVIVLATDASNTSWDRSTTPPTPWSALIAWPSFPPLVHELLRAAVQDRTALRNVQVGDLLRASVSDPTETSVMVSDPTGRKERLRLETEGDVTEWTLAETATRGVYSVRGGRTDGGVERYVVNVDTGESQLERFDAERLPPPLRPGDARADERPAASPAAPARFFRALLSAVLLLLFSDTLLAWYFGRSTNG